jgi:hypothetical protein
MTFKGVSHPKIDISECSILQKLLEKGWGGDIFSQSWEGERRAPHASIRVPQVLNIEILEPF